MGAGIGAAASIGGSLFGALGGNNQSGGAPTGEMNDLLSSALSNGLNYSQGYTDQAIGAENTGLASALSQLAQAGNTLSTYGQESQNALTTGFNQSQALNEPMRTAGYNALDNYQDSLHMARPKVGNAAMAQALTNDASSQGLLNTLQTQNASYNGVSGNAAPTSPYADPTAPSVTNSDRQAYINSNTSLMSSPTGGTIEDYTGVGGNDSASNYDPSFTSQIQAAGGNPGSGSDMYYRGSSNQINTGSVTPAAINSALISDPSLSPGYSNALTQYNAANNTYSQLGMLMGNYTPAQQQLALAYNRGLFSAPTQENIY